MEIQLYATCPDELTGLLAQEIASLGGTEVRTAYRVVYFSASKEVFYRVHLYSRLASRIYRILKEIPAHSPTIVFDKAKKIRFHELFSSSQAVSITVVAANDESPIPTHLIGSKLREAINDCFQHHLNVLPNQSSWDAVIGITGYFHHKRLMVSVDSSLESLRRRGVPRGRPPGSFEGDAGRGLAGGLRIQRDQAFLRSHVRQRESIVVEAAMMAINRAPLFDRKKGGFGFEYLLDFDSGLWQAIRDQARVAERPAPAGIFASDIDPQFVKIAQKTAVDARLETVVRFETKDFFPTEKQAERGLLIANIPYGVRMTEKDVSARIPAGRRRPSQKLL